MARPNLYSYVFGFNACELVDSNGDPVGYSDITGSFTAELNPNVVPTVGGAASYTRAARLGRSEGSATLSLNERPSWIDGAVSGGTVTDTAASATATFGTVTPVEGTSLNSLTFAAETGTDATPIIHKYRFRVEATAAAIVSVTYAGSSGVDETVNVTLSATAVPIGNTGVTITATASPSFTEGDIVTCEVTPPHGGIRTIGVPSIRESSEYGLYIYTGRGGDQDVIEQLYFPRVLVVGAPITRTDVEVPTTEVPCTVMAPDGGGDVYTRELIRRA